MSFFPTDYSQIIAKLDGIDPIAYAQTRNYTNGAVNYLSPYVSRGVISTKQILQHVLDKGYNFNQTEPFAKQLAWRDYFQRIWQEKNINLPIKNSLERANTLGIPKAVVHAQTDLLAIDQAINDLYQTGYMHNHNRLYVASLVCNIAQFDWLLPAKWMYYHLLDGDWASNACSWQWVAGLNSSKKYYANYENISKYTNTPLLDNYLNQSYESLASMARPQTLQKTELISLKTTLPTKKAIVVDNNLPTFIYNYYNLDTQWHKNEQANRILLIEPEIFEAYPISEKCFQFFLELSANIPAIQVYVGAFDQLIREYNPSKVYFKEHPLNRHYTGVQEPRTWLSEQVVGYYPSFFAYWKVLVKSFKNN